MSLGLGHPGPSAELGSSHRTLGCCRTTEIGRFLQKTQNVLLGFNCVFSFPNPAGADHRGAGGSDGGGDAVGSLDGSQSSHSNPTDPGRLASTSAGEASACLQFCIQTSCLSSRRCARIPAGCWRRGNPLAPRERSCRALRPGAEANLPLEWWLRSPHWPRPRLGRQKRNWRTSTLRDAGEVWQRAARLHLEESREGADSSPQPGKPCPALSGRQRAMEAASGFLTLACAAAGLNRS